MVAISDDARCNGIKVAVDWIDDLESSDSRIHKEKVIEKALMAANLGSANAQIFLFNCFLAYNPFFTYNIKQVPETENLINKANPWTRFWALCEALRTRSISGNRMRQSVADLSLEFDSDEWNKICRRVLIKDLRCGISEKTLNKILKKTQWAIPTFSCQLATDSENHANKLTGKVRLENKLDGVRVLAYIGTSNVVTLYSRNGKTFNNFAAIEDTLTRFAHKIKLTLLTGQGVILDGEVVSSSFQDLMKQAHRKRDVDTNDAKFYVFDYIPINDFSHAIYKKNQASRLESLAKVIDVIDSPIVKIMPGIEVDLDAPAGLETMKQFAKESVAAGFEGIMIKNLAAPYECKRTSNWMKWKPTITLDLEVVDVEEGTGRNQGRLGALVCSGTSNNQQIKVNVGSGFTDDDRVQFWFSHVSENKLLGNIVEVEADVITQNQDGSYSLRFPRFIRFRGFEAGEKL
jgi:DNA ligase-1